MKKMIEREIMDKVLKEKQKQLKLIHKLLEQLNYDKQFYKNRTNDITLYKYNEIKTKIEYYLEEQKKLKIETNIIYNCCMEICLDVALKQNINDKNYYKNYIKEIL